MNKRQLETLKAQLGSEKAVLEALEKQYRQALKDIDDRIKLLQADGLTQSRIYHIEYQKTLRKQVQAIIDKLHADTYTTLEQFLNDTYKAGYAGTMYDVAGHVGAPVITPIDQAAMVRAVVTDSKISGTLYDSLGVDAKALKKTIASEISRGIATGLTYEDIARNINTASLAPLARAKTIARTEGHRIYEASAEDARQAAVAAGADVVKVWDATLDGNTRGSHQRLDGQVREVDEPFEYGGKKTMRPGEFGDPAEDCNCRCHALTRSRSRMDADRLKIMQERAAYFGLDKTKDIEEFQRKYLQAAQTVEKSGKSGIIKVVIRPAEKDLGRQKTSSIRKALDTFGNRIAEHQQKIEHPEKFIPDWDGMDTREQEGLKKHWSKEIKNFEKARARRIEELKRRGEHDE